MDIVASLMVGVGMALAGLDRPAPVVLDFEQVSPVYPFVSNNIAALDYYNAGLSSAGTRGPDYGVEISPNGLVICLNTLEVVCELSNTSRGDGGEGSEQGALFFLSGSETYINVADGFDTGFSFNYVSVAVAGEARIYDGLNGTGTLLGTLVLGPNAVDCPGYEAPFCAFAPVGMTFDGVARSVSFAGVANQIVFDDITFGSATPGAVPEPATTLLLLGGVLLVGAVVRARRPVRVDRVEA